MERTSKVYQAYVRILQEELIPAMGCTEPIAIAYAAAKAREVLGQLPGSVWLGVSNNIIKNVKSVIVPNTGGMKGIEAAAAAGIVAGQAGKALEVISEVTEAQKTEMRRFLTDTSIRVEAVDNGQIFDIIVRLTAGEHTAAVRIAQYHTNIVHVEKDGQVLLDVPVEANAAACGHEGNAPTEDGLAGRDLLTIAHTLVNSLAIVSGIICDGAKPSCAAKIASSVEAGIMGYHMYLNGQQFRAGDGIVTKGVENTIRNVSQLGREGMRETDKEIVKIMMQEN